MMHFVHFRWVSAVHIFLGELSDFLEPENAWLFSKCIRQTASVIIILIFSLCTFSYAWLVYVVLWVFGYFNLHSYTGLCYMCSTEISLCRVTGGCTVVKVPLYSNFPHAFIRKTCRKVVVVGARAQPLCYTYRWLDDAGVDQFDCQFERRHAWGSIVSVCAVAATSIRLCPYTFMENYIVENIHMHSIQKQICVRWTYTCFLNIMRFVSDFWMLRCIFMPLGLSKTVYLNRKNV